MRRTLAAAIAATLGATSPLAGAVMLNPRGTGQVLIYPYYTVNHQQALVSAINTTGHGKALADTEEQMRPTATGVAFNRLPAIGFAATNYVNANVTPGVPSNYNCAYPHRSSASCTNSTNPQGVCE